MSTDQDLPEGGAPEQPNAWARKYGVDKNPCPRVQVPLTYGQIDALMDLCEAVPEPGRPGPVRNALKRLDAARDRLVQRHPHVLDERVEAVLAAGSAGRVDREGGES